MGKLTNSERLAYQEVPETCPHVDAALESAAETIKEQTANLRAALIEWIERAVDAEEQLIIMDKKIDDLESEIEDLKMELLESYE